MLISEEEDRSDPIDTTWLVAQGTSLLPKFVLCRFAVDLQRASVPLTALFLSVTYLPDGRWEPDLNVVIRVHARAAPESNEEQPAAGDVVNCEEVERRALAAESRGEVRPMGCWS